MPCSSVFAGVQQAGKPAADESFQEDARLASLTICEKRRVLEK